MTILAYPVLGQSLAFGVPPWPLPDPIDDDLVMIDPRCLNRDIHANGHTIAATTEYSTFRPAREPLHNWLYPPPDYPPGQGGMGPGKPFGQRMRQRFPHLQIALLCVAHPSTVGALVPGSEGYEFTLDTIRYARDVLGATIGGVLTNHGQADTGDVAQATGWADRYITLIENLRTALGIPDLPAVHSQLGLTSLYTDPVSVLTKAGPAVPAPGSAGWAALKAEQELVCARLPHSRMIRTELLQNWKFDRLHNSTVANILEGYAWADAVADLGHPLFVGSPYSSLPQMTFDTETDRQTVTCTAATIITKIIAGTLVNSTLMVNNTVLASGEEYLLTSPYQNTVKVTATRVCAGNWLAPFTVYDAADFRTPYALEGRS